VEYSGASQNPMRQWIEREWKPWNPSSELPRGTVHCGACGLMGQAKEVYAHLPVCPVNPWHPNPGAVVGQDHTETVVCSSGTVLQVEQSDA
jgi:hypothetical protein